MFGNSGWGFTVGVLVSVLDTWVSSRSFETWLALSSSLANWETRRRGKGGEEVFVRSCKVLGVATCVEIVSRRRKVEMGFTIRNRELWDW